MTRIIILEGVDGSGKSTLAKKLAEFHNAPVIHHTQHTDTRDYVTGLLGMGISRHPGAPEAIIVDRCWYSEPIYGNVYRGGADKVGPVNCRTLEQIYHRAYTTVVYCDPGWEQIALNWANRGDKEEMLDSINQLQRAYDLYQKRWMFWRLPTTRYDYLKHEGLNVIHDAPRTKPYQFEWKDLLV